MFSTLDQSLELESCPDGEDCASRELLHYAHYDHTELVRQRLETLQCPHVTSIVSRKLMTQVEKTQLKLRQSGGKSELESTSREQVQNIDFGVEEENVGNICEGDSMIAQREDLVFNNNEREESRERESEQEPENPFAIVAEKDSQVKEKILIVIEIKFFQMSGVGAECEDKSDGSLHHSPAKDSPEEDGQWEGNNIIIMVVPPHDVTGEAC